MKGVKAVKRKRTKNLNREPPTLKFTPTAWAKLLFLRDIGNTEVGAFGICPTDALLVEDIELVKQTCSWATVAFDDESVADFFDDQVERGLKPDQFARVWIHTHPGASAEPSFTDEETFERVFGNTDWAVMFILACGGETYARLRSSTELDQQLLRTCVDFTVPFEGSDSGAWEADYDTNVTKEQVTHLWDDVFDFVDDEPDGRPFEEGPFIGDGYPIDDSLLHHYMEDEHNHNQFEPTDY